MSHGTETAKNTIASSEYPLNGCVHELVERQAERTPDAIAVVEGQQRLTYCDLNSRANRLAAYLSKRGVGPDVPVAICLKRSTNLMVAMLAVLKAGGACVPLDPAYPAERLEYMLQDARPALLLTQDGLLPSRIANLRETIDLPAMLETIDQDGSPQSGSDQPGSDRRAGRATSKDIAYIIYTSGSTGKPRGVLLTHEGLVNHHVVAQKLYDLRSSDRVLQFSSISFDIALEEIFPTWVAGGTLVLRTEATPLGGREFVRWIAEQGITVLDLPTAYWHELVHQLADLKQPMPVTMRLVIVGGEKPSAKALNSWNKLVAGKIRWINTYGPSEASIIATAYEPSANREWEESANIPIGSAIANTRVYIVDRDLNPVPEGVSGELLIGGVGLACGYLNQPQRTAEKFIGDPFSAEPGARLYKTGDMARRLPNGEIEFLGRVDDQVKIRGFRVEMGEVESALLEHPGVRQAVVIAREDEAGMKRLVAYVVPVSESAPSEAELRKFLSERLPEYMVPAAVASLDKLPLTPNGKVDKKALPEPMRVQARTGAEGKTPQDPFQAQLAQLWETVLGKKPIGVDENFFELGGHSLLAVRLMHSIEVKLGKRLTITTLLHAPTIERMAALLQKEEASPASSSLVAMQEDGMKPPFFCVHGIGGTILRFRHLSQLVGSDQPFYGLQAQGLDGQQPLLTRVEDMAALYIKELRTVQPQGPYYIGGYSLGGMVALEMAHQLKAEGHAVGLVVLLDTFPGALKSTGSLFRTYLTLPLDQQWAHFTRKMNAFRRSLRRRVAMMRLPAILKNVREACHTAARTYKPKPYDGPVVLFRASEKGLSSVNQESAWKKLAPQIKIYEVSGHHGNIVDEPQVRLLGEEVKSCLETAFRKRSGDPATQSVAFASAGDSQGELEIA